MLSQESDFSDSTIHCCGLSNTIKYIKHLSQREQHNLRGVEFVCRADIINGHTNAPDRLCMPVNILQVEASVGDCVTEWTWLYQS